jgi:hypothetical protein
MKAHIVVAAAVLAGAAAATSAGAATVKERQSAQQQRVGHGVATGALTPRETLRLESRAASIACQEAHFRATGGVFTGRERAVIHQRLDALSGAIRHQKHDLQRR